jgi:pilus assembly protein CpaF
MNAFGAMADRYRVRVREEMTVLPPGADTREVRLIVAARLRELLERDRVILPVIDMERLVEEVVDDAVGLGPLEPLMRDPAVTEVIANGPGAVFVERGGKLVPEAAIPRRRAPPSGDRARRRRRRPAGRRREPDGRRAPS